MKKWVLIVFVGLILLTAAGLAFQYRSPKINSWSSTLPGIGSSSSPRLTDLTGDGVLNIVLGTGRQELLASDTAVIALDGATGQLLWHVAARDQIVGSATLFERDRRRRE